MVSNTKFTLYLEIVIFLIYFPFVFRAKAKIFENDKKFSANISSQQKKQSVNQLSFHNYLWIFLCNDLKYRAIGLMSSVRQ